MKHYHDCITRLESRGSAPPTREYADSHMEAVEAAGIEACWHSAVDGSGRALFPSKVYPHCHPDADMEAFKYLLDRLHAAGRPVLSWYPLNMSAGLIEQNPDWAMRYMTADSESDDGQGVHGCCYNSPYGELLPKFAAEVVRDVGFDGMWFDGSTMSNHGTWPFYQPGCICDFCRERFKRDTGEDLPEGIDFESRTFRLWINWRYDVLMDVWTRTVSAIHEAKPDAVVCFNNYRRRNAGYIAWNTAIPMRRLRLDAIISGELDGFGGQADFQMKAHRAYACTGGVESWWPMCNYWQMWTPDVETLAPVQAISACIAAGGAMSTGGANPSIQRDTLTAVQQAGQRLQPYRDGDPLEYAAIWCSQATQDFFYKHEAEQAYNQMHGAAELCLQAHLQTSVVFDDHVADGDIAGYPVLIAPNVACVSRAQATHLRDYVENGGVLIASGQFGRFDELGYEHEHPVCDELLGIRERGEIVTRMALEFTAEHLIEVAGAWLSLDTAFVTVRPADDVEVMAMAGPYAAMDGGSEYGEKIRTTSPAIWQRRAGKGTVAYIALDLFGESLVKPMKRTVDVFGALLTGLVSPSIAVEAPLCVTVNSRRLGNGEIAVILHNAPGTTFRYPGPAWCNYLHNPGEVIPIHDIRIRTHGLSFSRARSGPDGHELEILHGADILLPRLALTDAVVLSP